MTLKNSEPRISTTVIDLSKWQWKPRVIPNGQSYRVLALTPKKQNKECKTRLRLCIVSSVRDQSQNRKPAQITTSFFFFFYLFILFLNNGKCQRIDVINSLKIFSQKKKNSLKICYVIKKLFK